MKVIKAKRSLALGFGLKIGFEILILISIMVMGGIFSLKKILYTNSISSYTQLLDANIQGLNYRNSKFMQQLRFYTNSDLIKSGKITTADIVDWLIAHEKVRSGDFREMYYVDMATATGYSDTGIVKSFSNDESYLKIKTEELSQYISNPVGTSAEDSAYYVCKTVKKSGQIIGYFAGTISHETLSTAIDSIPVGENGFAFLLEQDGTVMAFPDSSMISKANFLRDKNQKYTGINEIALSMTQGEKGSEWVMEGKSRNLIVYGPVTGTPWSLAFSVPADEVYQISDMLTFIEGILGAITAVILFLTILLSLHRTVRPLLALNKNISEIATGTADLTQRIPVANSNEIGQVTEAFNKFTDKLQNIMKEIKHSKSNLDAAGIELNDGIIQNITSIEEILSNMEDVRKQILMQIDSVDQTTTAVNQISQNIETLEQMINTQAAGVTQAASAVEEMIGNISSVNSSVDKMAVSFEQLANKAVTGNQQQKIMSQKIQEIEEQSAILQNANKVIASIASQTNLLAMNAAIEAAHAGAAGRGFSVVADEIRKLSETSTAQSKKIGIQLKEISSNIDSVVQTSESTKATFISLGDSINQTDMIVHQIKDAMDEQTAGSKQISDALRDMSDSTSSVKTASMDMAVENKAILNQIKNLKDATQTMTNSVSVMEESAGKIRETGSSLNGVSTNLSSAIVEIGIQIDSFKV